MDTACTSVCHVHAVGMKARRGCWDSLGLELQTVSHHVGVCWELSLGPLEDQSVPLNTEPSHFISSHLSFLHLMFLRPGPLP